MGLMAGATDTANYQEYLTARDPVLGWPSPKEFGKGEFDITGSRIVPEFPETDHPACVALFGDSFTWGDEVSAEHAYGNVLAKGLGCRVANFGIGGYGTDQAVIRYIQSTKGEEPIIVLGHFSDNILRNVNRLRDFLAGGRFGFKPRFILGSDGVEVLPMPNISIEEYASISYTAVDLLPHEYFAPGTEGGPGIMRFPYSLAVLQALRHYRISSALAGIRPTYIPFYQAQHPSGALQITEAIILEAVNVAHQRGQKLFLLLIPDLHDLIALQAGRDPSYLPLKVALEKNGVRTIDSGVFIARAIGGRNVCEIYTRCGSSHFNPEGYSLLADAVLDQLSALQKD